MTTATPNLAALLAQLAHALAEQNTTTPPIPEPRTLPPRVLLTVEEAAQQLGIGRTLTWRLIKNGDLESVRIGRLRRIPTTAITDYATRLITQQTRKNNDI